MATNSRILAWEIPWTEEPGRLTPMEVTRVAHNFETKPQSPSVYPLSLLRFSCYYLLSCSLFSYSFNVLAIP